MGKVILDMAMSLDGIATDKSGSYLYPINAIKKSGALDDLINNVGAVVMDRACYDMAKGDFTGYEYQAPIFVVTKSIPRKVAKGENAELTFKFVKTIREAITKAKETAADKNIMIVGLIDAAQQSLKTGLVEEIIIRLMPVIVSKGKKLLENLGSRGIQLKIMDTKIYSDRTDLRFTVKNK